MDDGDVRLVRESVAHLHRRKAEAASMFYARLFDIAPEVRPLFKTDLKAQGDKLMETLFVAIAALRDPEGLAVLLRKLGREHRVYGATDSHYDAVGEALIWTLAALLGPGFTPQVERAWIMLYAEVSGVMKQGSRDT